jgi:cyclic pyranopterin phosphate synthase
MPIDNVQFQPRDQLLTFEEIHRFVRVAAALGIDKIRLTGGEPLVRSNMASLVRMLVDVEGIDEVAMTTNGILLAEHAESLRNAGLHRLNISLDAVTDENFRRIARRDGLAAVIAGIDAARHAGFANIRLNAVSIRGITEDEIVPLAEFARDRDLELRFIEYMPLDAEDHWQREKLLTGLEVLNRIESVWGPLAPCDRPDPSQPAVDFQFADGQGRIGFINPVSEPFCGNCNRLRITAEGQVRNCLFSATEWDARQLIRGDSNDDEIAQLIRDCVAAKKPGHGIDSPEFLKPVRAMYQIGG